MEQSVGLLLVLITVAVTQNCGVSKVRPVISNDPVERTRVVGGNEVVPHSWPWIVSLQSNKWHFCGGTLLPMSSTQSDIVLTASHCVKNKDGTVQNPSGMQVVLGNHKHSVVEPGEQRVNVVKIAAHPRFNFQDLLDDVAVLKLQSPVKYSNTISPICLAKPGQKPDSRSTCVVAGWGNTIELSNSKGRPDRLQQLKVPAPDDALCSRDDVWSVWYNATAQVCAGRLGEKRNVCSGDSGGPLMCEINKQWTQIGVASYVSGRGCQDSTKPGMFARVATYNSWITDRANEMSAVGRIRSHTG